MSKIKSWTLLFSFLLTVNYVSGQSGNLWGNLQKGKYNVGFTTLQKYDLSRTPIREQKKLPAEQQKGRAVQINIWYPSNQRLKKLSFLHYLTLTSREIDFRQSSIKPDELVDLVAQEQSNSHGININKEGLKEFIRKDYKMEGMPDASPAKGKFPVILIGPETAFKWCVMAEYFASNGYVVVVTPNTGSSEKLMDFERSLFEKQNFIIADHTSIDDLRYVMSEIKTLKYADASQIGILGYSSGVSIGIGLITTGIEAKAIVSLEGAIGGYIGGEVLSMTAFYSPHAITQPLLHIFTPGFGYDHHWINEYKYSDRTIIATYPVRHEDFTSYGPLEKFIPGISGKPKAAPQLAFEIGALYTLNFFNAHILKDKDAIKFIENDLSQNSIPQSFQQEVEDEWKGIKRLKGLQTFDEHELKDIYDKSGFEGVKKIYDDLAEINTQPVSKSTFYNLGRFLKTVEEKEAWYSAYLKSFPNSSEAHYLLAEAKQKLKKNEEAIKLYEKTLELFNQTDHILLENIFKNVINRRLKILRGEI